MSDICAARFEAFGSAGNAGMILFWMCSFLAANININSVSACISPVELLNSKVRIFLIWLCY
jgi:hypothetical protein